jgi:hypothetical protein
MFPHIGILYLNETGCKLCKYLLIVLGDDHYVSYANLKMKSTTELGLLLDLQFRHIIMELQYT